mgnify:FL=1
MKKPSKKERNYLPPREASRGNDKFYNSTTWRSFRKKQLIQQRIKDLVTARMLYKNNTSISLYDYNTWLSTEHPLCVHCLQDDNIRKGNTLDHIHSRSTGGADIDPSNVQWLCENHHAVKSQSERGT